MSSSSGITARSTAGTSDRGALRILVIKFFTLSSCAALPRSSSSAFNGKLQVMTSMRSFMAATMCS